MICRIIDRFLSLSQESLMNDAHPRIPSPHRAVSGFTFRREGPPAQLLPDAADPFRMPGLLDRGIVLQVVNEPLDAAQGDIPFRAHHHLAPRKKAERKILEGRILFVKRLGGIVRCRETPADFETVEETFFESPEEPESGPRLFHQGHVPRLMDRNLQSLS